MPEFTAKDVQKLRQMTGVGMLDAKKALEETGGDIDQAIKLLREKGWPARPSGPTGTPPRGRGHRPLPTASPRSCSLRSETDFVAKSDQFVAFVASLADLVAVQGRGGHR